MSDSEMTVWIRIRYAWKLDVDRKPLFSLRLLSNSVWVLWRCLQKRDLPVPACPVMKKLFFGTIFWLSFVIPQSTNRALFQFLHHSISFQCTDWIEKADLNVMYLNWPAANWKRRYSSLLCLFFWSHYSSSGIPWHFLYAMTP